MYFGFSFIGLLFLIMLFIPNVLWNKFQPTDYEKYSKRENIILLAFERVGQVLVCIFSLFCGVNFNLSICVAIPFIILILYEFYWIKYFKSNKTMGDMYSDFLKIPLPGATLPVLAFVFLGICSDNILLIFSTIILGTGHIGIHLAHKKEIN